MAGAHNPAVHVNLVVVRDHGVAVALAGHPRPSNLHRAPRLAHKVPPSRFQMTKVNFIVTIFNELNEMHKCN